MAGRERQRLVAVVAAAAMLLPWLLTALPPLTPTAAFALERDIAASRCLDTGPRDPATPHAPQEQCCILCPSAQGPVAGMAEAAPVPGRRASASPVQFAAGEIRVPRVLAAGSSARGPPAV